MGDWPALITVAALPAATWVLLTLAQLRWERTAARVPGSIALIIPARCHEGLAQGLQCFATQNAPDFAFVVVTATVDEPAADVARTLASSHPHVRHVVAGPATGCGQKNHNLLAGLAVVDARTQWLVFSDDDCFPDSADWLERFVACASATSATATTSFRRVRAPRWPSVGTALYFFCTAAQRAVMSLTQRFTWGGATAIRRADFERLGLAARWSRTVVDDVSLSQAVRAAKGTLRYSRASMLDEDAPRWSVSTTFSWLVRQFQFLRWYDPLALALGLAFLWASAVLLWVWPLSLATASFILVSALTHARPVRWALVVSGLVGLPVLLVFAATAATVAAWRRRVTWGGLSYDVRDDGSVEVSGSST